MGKNSTGSGGNATIFGEIMAETFGASAAIKVTGAARPPLPGMFIEALPKDKEDDSGWGIESMLGSGPRKPISEYPSFDSEQIVEELRGRP